MKRLLQVFIFLFPIVGCNKFELQPQPIPTWLLGQWKIARVVNVTFQTSFTYNPARPGDSNAFYYFSNTYYNTHDPYAGGTKITKYGYEFTADPNNSQIGKIKFAGEDSKNNKYEISWSRDTLIMTPENLFYDIQYYIRD